VPASRSRTERWRDCLEQIHQRGGGIEFALAGPTPPPHLARTTDAPNVASDESSDADADIAAESTGNDAAVFGPKDLVWRVRLLHLTEDMLVVEQPAAMGQTVRIAADQDLVCVMTVGQNRWMFRTRTLGDRVVPVDQGRVAGLCLQMPTTVERCMRRNFCRVSMAELHLPHVECWPLFNPASVVPTETANRSLIRQAIAGDKAAIQAALAAEPSALADAGPMFRARLLNIGGGGVGLIIDRSEAAGLDKARSVWLRINLQPKIPAPIGMTTKLAHSHVDSEGNVHAGLAFDFSLNPAHRDFIVEQFQRVVASLQGPDQRRAQAA
jgi:hypothetical protein